MEIRRISPFVYDVFTGKQWGTHSRVRQTRQGVYVMSGERLPHRVLKALADILAPNMPVNYGQTLDVTVQNCQMLASMGK